MAASAEDFKPRATRVLLAGGLGLALAAGSAACEGGGGSPDAQEPGDTPAPSPTATATAQPALSASDALKLARAALLSPDSPLLDGYEATVDAAVTTLHEEFAPLYRCRQEESADGRLATYSQVFEGPWPKIHVSAHAFDRSSVAVLEQLRETWDSECATFDRTDIRDPYRSERIETVAAPGGVESAQWAADCAEVTILEDGTGGIVRCSALVAVGEHVILDIRLDGLLIEWGQYADLLGAIATDVRAAQE